MGRKASRRNERFEFPAGTICVQPSPRAMLLEFPGVNGLDRQWVPLSQLRSYGRRGKVGSFYSVPGWLANKNGLRRRAKFEDKANAGNV